MTASTMARVLLLLQLLLLSCRAELQYQSVTPDNSVLLANALGQARNYASQTTLPVCFIKIDAVWREGMDDGARYVYEVQGCEVHEFSGFGVCKHGECGVQRYQIHIFAPRDSITATVQSVWEL
ncbi:hypothetical protein P43SY_004395 [Pythium insidiosum]|uniref:Uncharacterized protein n=1 Tax=Pythium insidiosum TaxID=114742 RepID=A0AAD5LP48_PYTIN|nr:hypothetical protein P43SY_004395 [Pythium insidiosum]KAJ0411827.1 hypothetical protein ATCC90586_002980 [Pythium insidiosum]